jgi:hypothetical protein
MQPSPSLTDGEDRDDISLTFSDEEKDGLFRDKNPFLRPADRGSHAWLFLISSFMIEGLALGTLPLVHMVDRLLMRMNYRVSWRVWCFPAVLQHQ